MDTQQCNLYKTFVRIEVQRIFPVQNRGRPTKITFDDAYEDILSGRTYGDAMASVATKNCLVHYGVQDHASVGGGGRLSHRVSTSPSALPTPKVDAVLLHRFDVCQEHLRHELHRTQSHGPRQTSDQAVYGCRQQRCVARHASDARKPFRHASLRADAGQSSCAARTRKRNVRRQGVRLKRQPTH